MEKKWLRLSYTQILCKKSKTLCQIAQFQMDKENRLVILQPNQNIGLLYKEDVDNFDLTAKEGALLWSQE